MSAPATQKPLADNAVNHQRNGLQILQLLLDERTGQTSGSDQYGSTTAALRDAIARFTFALELMERPAPTPTSLPVRLLPWCPMTVRERLLATSALGFNPRTGDECVQLTIVCPPLVAGGHEYLEQLQAVGKDFLQAIVSDRIDVLDEDAAQVRRVQAVLEAGSDVAGVEPIKDLRLIPGPAELHDADRQRNPNDDATGAHGE